MAHVIQTKKYRYPCYFLKEKNNKKLTNKSGNRIACQYPAREKTQSIELEIDEMRGCVEAQPEELYDHAKDTAFDDVILIEKKKLKFMSLWKIILAQMAFGSVRL